MAACFHFMLWIYRCRLYSFSALLKLENVSKAFSMSSPVILNKIGFYSLLCGLNISCAEKIIKKKATHNKTTLCEMSSAFYLKIKFELGR